MYACYVLISYSFTSKNSTRAKDPLSEPELLNASKASGELPSKISLSNRLLFVLFTQLFGCRNHVLQRSFGFWPGTGF